MSDTRVFFLVSEGEVTHVQPGAEFDGKNSVLVYALDEADALRLADLYDRDLIGVGNVSINGVTYAAVTDAEYGSGTVSGAQKWIATASNLDELLGILQRLKATMREQDRANFSLANLPTFGGSAPSDTHGVWSWDEDRVLVGSSIKDMRIEPR